MGGAPQGTLTEQVMPVSGRESPAGVTACKTAHVNALAAGAVCPVHRS